jgi:peptide deformylase
VLPIVACGDPVLRRPAEPVDPAALDRRDLRRLIVRMRATMEDAPGVGLAAPQIGEPIQLAVLQDGPERWSDMPPADLEVRGRTELPFTVLVNPVVMPEPSGTVAFYEGCLSVPGLAGVVARHRAVRVDALDEHGEPQSLTLEGWPARIAQHELDHLQGVLYLDRVLTRSLSTVDNYLERWARESTAAAAEALGFATE